MLPTGHCPYLRMSLDAHGDHIIEVHSSHNRVKALPCRPVSHRELGTSKLKRMACPDMYDPLIQAINVAVDRKASDPGLRDRTAARNPWDLTITGYRRSFAYNATFKAHEP